MSIRTNEAEVEAVLGVSVASGALDTFIANASLWVDNYLEGQTCVDEDKLQTIEAYIAAYLYALTQQGTTSAGPVIARKIEGVETRYGTSGSSSNTEGPRRYLHIAAAYDACGIVAERWLDRPRFRFRVGAGYDPRHTGSGG